jgi:hypothetical protein
MQGVCYDISTQFIDKDVVSLKQQPSFGTVLGNRSFPCGLHTSTTIINNTSPRDIFTTMAAIDEAIAFLRSCDTSNVSKAARRLNVNRSTLSKRFHGKSHNKAKVDKKQQLLTKKQELVLIDYIIRLSKWYLPPTLVMVTF